MDRKEKRRQIAESFLFSWLPERNTFRTLLAFTVFSAVIHFIGFYLFIVDRYPEQVKPDIRRGSITLLDPENTNVSSLMARMEDRIVFLQPSVSALGAERPGTSRASVRFRPSFKGARPNLKRGVDDAETMALPLKLAAKQSNRINWNNPIELSPNLEKRGVAGHSILDDYLDLIPHLPNIRFNFVVDDSGVPTQIRIREGRGNENEKILADAIGSMLRFNPKSNRADSDSGWLELGRRVGPDL